MHAASRWQVDTIGGDFSAPVHDSGRTTSDLTAHRVRGLSSTTQYKSRVRHQDENGNWSDWSDPAADTAETFTTLGATAIAPKVVNVVPAAGATEVAVGAQPALTFNVPVDPATVTIHTIRLLRKGVPVPQAPGSPSVQGGGITVRIQPAGLLDPSAKYVIAVSGGASGVRSLDSSIAGKPSSSAFTTEGALQSSNPANGAQDVSIGVHPQLHFKWAVDAATATVSKLKLIDQSSGKKVALASVVTSGAIVTLTPAAPLASRHKFAVIVPAGAAGLRFADGRQLGKPVKVTFRTMGSTQ
jgi:hypothetical protein